MNRSGRLSVPVAGDTSLNRKIKGQVTWAVGPRLELRQREPGREDREPGVFAHHGCRSVIVMSSGSGALLIDGEHVLIRASSFAVVNAPGSPAVRLVSPSRA